MAKNNDIEYKESAWSDSEMWRQKGTEKPAWLVIAEDSQKGKVPPKAEPVKGDQSSSFFKPYEVDFNDGAGKTASDIEYERLMGKIAKGKEKNL